MTDRADWRRIRLKPGDWACPVHGIITPAVGAAVPYCGESYGARPCQRIALLSVRRAGKVVSVEPRPAFCGRGHPFRPGRYRLGTSPCPCVPGGHHRSWTCVTCGDVSEFPPHDPAVTRPR